MLLEVENLSKSFVEPQGQPLLVLKKLNLELKEAEKVAIVGPSGSGKSTLLHLIAGLEQPDEGIIRFRGQVLNLADRAQIAFFRRRELGFVFQFYHLLSELNVIENIMVPLLLNGLSYANAREEALRMLNEICLEDKANYQVEMLSGGEMQRVAILRAVAHSPSLLLADEPTGNLDPDTQEVVLRFLLGLVRERNLSIICVTHSNEIASAFDKVYLLKNGRLVLQ